MIKVTNIAPGPRGLNAKEGPVMLAPGQTLEVEFKVDDEAPDAELNSAKSTGWFVFEGQSAKEVDKAYDAMPDDELREFLKGKGVTADGRWGRDKLIAEAKKAVSA